MNRRHFMSCGCSALALAGCAAERAGGEAPAPTIAPGYRPPGSGTEASFWYHLEKLEREMKYSPFLLRDPALNRYVRDVVCRVVGEYCPDVRVYLLRRPYFNASMAANGMMVIWSGLLLRVSNEAQLAAVIGHELGHYVRQHTLLRWRDAKSKSDIGAFLGVGLGAAGLVARLVLLASIYGFSRDQERQADAFGLKAMAAAGYSPIEASRVWRRLIRERDAKKDKQRSDFFFSTHPAPEERMKKLESMAKSLAPGDGAGPTYRRRFVEAVADHRRWLLADQLRLGEFGPSEALLDMLIEDGAGLGELHFYKGEIYRLRAEEGEASKARDSYRAAIAVGGEPAELYRSLGLLHRKAGERKAAVSAFEKYLERKPDAFDRLMIRSYLEPGS